MGEKIEVEIEALDSKGKEVGEEMEEHMDFLTTYKCSEKLGMDGRRWIEENRINNGSRQLLLRPTQIISYPCNELFYSTPTFHINS